MIYAFKCDACGRQADVFRKVTSRDDPQTCQCGESMRRVISAANFKFKATREDPGKTTRRILGLKRGERTFEDPFATDNKVVRLSGNNEEAKAQIIQETQRNRPHVKRKDIQITNL